MDHIRKTCRLLKKNMIEKLRMPQLKEISLVAIRGAEGRERKDFTETAGIKKKTLASELGAGKTTDIICLVDTARKEFCVID